MEPSEEASEAAEEVVRGREEGVAETGDIISSLW
jgi:hypothetical protein